jgi:hypothetical protein
MERLSEDQIQDMIGRKGKIRFVFMVTAFVAAVINAFYIYELYKLGGEKTFLLKSIEVFNILLSFGVYVLIVQYLRNNVTDVSYFLWYVDEVLSPSDWKIGKKPFMFVRQWRMYSNYEELSHDISCLRNFFTKYLYWMKFSVVMLLPVLVYNSVEVLFCGESARVFMVWTDGVAFFLFFLPKCLFALLLVFSLFMFLYYKDKIKALMNDPSKYKITAMDVSDSI